MGIFKKEKEYAKEIDLDKLSNKIEKYLKDDKWHVQSVESEKGKVIQARKDGILREIFAADRALTIILSKTIKGFKVEMGVGKWIQNITVTVVESLLFGLFLVIDVPEMLWNAEIEKKILNKIDDFVAEIIVEDAGKETEVSEEKEAEVVEETGKKSEVSEEKEAEVVEEAKGKETEVSEEKKADI